MFLPSRGGIIHSKSLCLFLIESGGWAGREKEIRHSIDGAFSSELAHAKGKPSRGCRESRVGLVGLKSWSMWHQQGHGTGFGLLPRHWESEWKLEAVQSLSQPLVASSSSGQS